MKWKVRNVSEAGESERIPQLRRPGKGPFRASVYGRVEGEGGPPPSCLVQGPSSPQQGSWGKEREGAAQGCLGTRGSKVKG